MFVSKQPINLKRLILFALICGFSVLAFTASPALAATINVPADYSTIQAAVNAASPGDTINVSAGTYTEAPYINKNLTLNGAGRDVTTIQAPAVLPLYAWNSGANGLIAIDTATVGISGFKIDGLHKGDGGDTFAGVHFWQSSGSIADCKITAFRDSTLGGNQDGFGIIVNHNWDVSYPQNVNIANNIIDDYQKGGIVVSEIDSNATINNNTVTGQGPTIAGQIAQNGIQIGYGAGGGITNNTVTAHDYTPTSWSASGILLTGTDGVQIMCNNVTGNEVGMALSEDEVYGYGGANNSNVTLNNVTGNQTGVQVEGGTLGNTGNTISHNTIAGNTDIGVDNTTIVTVNASSNWWGSADGPGTVGPGTGDKVSTNVTYSPWLTTASACSTPALTLTKTGAAYWSYAEWEARILSVPYSIGNSGPIDAYNVQIVGTSDTNGVSLNSTAPVSLGSIPAGNSPAFILKYNVPNNVGSFNTTLYVTAEDPCQNIHTYPGPYSGG